MKVQATRAGFYEKLREAGEVFDVKEGEAGSWFEPVESVESAPKKPRQQAEDKKPPVDDQA